MAKKKIYVCSGDIQVVVVADAPMDAIKIALDGFSAGKAIDPEYFRLDERGFRDDATAQYKVPVEQALAEAGYFLDHTSLRVFSDGGESPSVEE